MEGRGEQNGVLLLGCQGFANAAVFVVVVCLFFILTLILPFLFSH